MAERRRFSRRLTTRLLITILVFSTVAVLAITGFGFYHAYSTDYQSRIVDLKEQSQARVEREQAPFLQAQNNTQLLAEAFLRDYQRFRDDPKVIARFDAWFVPSDGIRRMLPSFAEGHYIGERYYQGLTGFLGHYELPYSNELKARVVLASETLAAFAPAWQNDFANTHITMPENILLHYAPDKPWGLLADSKLDIRRGAVVAATLQSNNPARLAAWTGLYYDLSAKYWAVTYQHPVDLNGQHLITPSHDLYLSQIIERLITPFKNLSLHFIFNPHGQLIASPNQLPEETQFAGVLHVDRLVNPLYADLFSRIENTPPRADAPVMIMPAGDDYIYIVTLMPGPDWYYVTRYPAAQIRWAAIASAISQALQSLILLLFIMGIVFWFIRRQVSLPLRRLVNVADMIAEGKYQEASRATIADVNACSEIGLLNRTMRDMAERIEDHQQDLIEQIEKRTAELAKANVALERLAHVDGLTGAMNRRAFDRDLQNAIEQADKGAAKLELILLDVDFFKLYNDNQGHLAGDHVLKQIVATLQGVTDAGIYRYGGEEIAVLCNADSNNNTCAELAERLRSSIQLLAIPHPDSCFGVVTVSVGVTYHRYGKDSNALILEADKALYVAKNKGRNCVQLNS